MSTDELNYYRARCQAETALAQTSKNSAVAAIHRDMAALYEKLIALDQRPDLVVVDESYAQQPAAWG